ncbi:DUF6458 family protein [Enemella evansiae]|uniref:DUF6458 domain-containing protein n=1 Tax=Enemella evansiae TaxID=2016499 RepID=A0A255GPX4_9ACTN|nr:DUF6458 family protein [Enemella evansiae]OYO09354.1 hypothetical protein BI335_18660 [Enemella evansiae]OYO17880.1 hypothetical protein CGZ94_03175 [Enemella evansiae]TDO89951.1 hypothetical protein C8D81_2840 [Enemella evansiae]
MRAARLGGPIALIVIGLVLALAIRDSISGVDLVMIGWIAAGAGAVWLLLELVMNRPRSTRTREVYRDDV